MIRQLQHKRTAAAFVLAILATFFGMVGIGYALFTPYWIAEIIYCVLCVFLFFLAIGLVHDDTTEKEATP
jgi:uncharacterized membrane protein